MYIIKLGLLQDERIIDKDVANPFKILSAYFITVATTRPPIACNFKKTNFFLKDKK